MLRFNQYFKTKPAVTALEIPKWDVKTEGTALVSVGLIVDGSTIESEAFSVRGGYEVQQGWALGPLKIGWQLVCRLLVPQILDSFFNNHVLFGTPHLVDQVSLKMSAYLCFKYNLFINCYRALVFHQSYRALVFLLPFLEPTLLWNFLLRVLQCESHSTHMQNDLLWRRPVVMFSEDMQALINKNHLSLWLHNA